uniref:RRM domain-containing protein n=1 Tax=Syphacia muris TaxID=451379 RepID=A0A158R629_9BILA
MYQPGARPLRPGESGPGAYPLVGGMPPAGVFGGAPQPLKQREITRVFVGNINTNIINREEIIRLFGTYGTLLGVTLFKGYAFIQYSNANEADFAVSTLNGYNWNGSVLDVKLAIAGMKTHNASSSSNGVLSVKRGADGWGSNGSVKKERIEDSMASNITSQNERNRQVASSDSAGHVNLYEAGMPDTLICGGCRFVTSDLEQFREHRKAPCSSTVKEVVFIYLFLFQYFYCLPLEAEGKKSWQCSMCEEVCSTGGALIEHANERHNIRLQRATE